MTLTLLFLLLTTIIPNQNLKAEMIDLNELRKIHSPRREGSTLIISGRIDSHIYDYLAYETEALKNIETISLNSFGGDHNWALAIAEKIKTLNKKTMIPSNQFCASACVFLFAAGKGRIMAKGTWLGVHGARLGSSYAIVLQQKCSELFSQPKNQLTESCKEHLAKWEQSALSATHKAFGFMEEMGVSSDLLTDYLKLEDDPNWLSELNVLKKPDWVVSAELAQTYGLATEILQDVRY